MVGDKKENILGVFSYPYVIQQRLTGTAEAVRTALPSLKEKDDILILPADTLLLEEDILNDFIQMHHQRITILVFWPWKKKIRLATDGF